MKNKRERINRETNMNKKISALLLGTALMLAAENPVFAQDKTVKIGALSDQSGLYADLGGPGSTLAAQMAVEDSGLAAKGWKIEVISGDQVALPREDKLEAIEVVTQLVGDLSVLKEERFAIGLSPDATEKDIFVEDRRDVRRVTRRA